MSEPSDPCTPSATPPTGEPASPEAVPTSSPAGRLEDPSDLFPPPGDLLGELVPPASGEISFAKRVVLIASGVALILLGFVFWLTPVMTGIPFWLAGLVLLARASEPVRLLINGGDRRLPTRVRTLLRWARDKTRRTPAPNEPSEPHRP